MTVELNNDEIKALVDKKVDTLLDDIIKERIQKLLFDKVEGIFGDWNNMDILVENIVREVVEPQVAKIDEETLKKVSEDIAINLESFLRESINYTISSAFKPYSEEEED